MAGEVKYRQIKGRDEEIPVFGKLSRSVVKRGADKIYWRMKDVREKRFGTWDDGVWLDCETGDIRFGERLIKEDWDREDYYCKKKYFCLCSYQSRIEWRRLHAHSWYLGSLSEWRGPDSEIEPRLAARLAEAAEFNFGLDFTGPEEENPFLVAANEVARFYDARARNRREEDAANGKNAADDEESGDENGETSFRYCESEAFEEWEAQEKRNQENDDAKEYDYWENDDRGAFDKKDFVAKNDSEKKTEEKSLAEEFAEWDREYHYERGVPVYYEVKKNRYAQKFETPSRIVFDASPLALVPRYWAREREIENAEPKPTAPKVSAAKDAEAWRDYWTADRERNERVKARKNELTGGFNFRGYLADESALLGELDELIAEAKGGTSSEGEETNGEGAPATRSDALSDDWRERLPSLLEYRLDRCNVLFQAAKMVYVEVIGTYVWEMKRLEVWVAPDGYAVDVCRGGNEKKPSWLKIGTLKEFYEAGRRLYWGSRVKKEDKFSCKYEAQHWLAREIGRRLEAALKTT